MPAAARSPARPPYDVNLWQAGANQPGANQPGSVQQPRDPAQFGVDPLSHLR
jgi:hypothetical protein